VVIVNDGSTDGSRKILEEYLTDSRVTIIDKENGGLSSARNAALKKIYGKYITFVDSDDMVNLDAYAKSMKNIIETDSDIVCYDIKMKRRKKIRRRKKRKNKMRRKIYVNDNINAMRDRSIYPSICNKIFRRKLINDYNIRFKKELYF
jgi:glycosyltransferase involved in cell wall biosynthesis